MVEVNPAFFMTLAPTVLLTAAATASALCQSAHRTVARANRLDVLLRRNTRTVAENKEVQGLMAVDSYDESASWSGCPHVHNTLAGGSSLS